MSNARTFKTVIVYRDPEGNGPFTDWHNSLRDPTTRRRILKRLLRLELGQYGDFKPAGAGVNEHRSFLMPAIESILVKMATPSSSYFVAAIKTAGVAICNRQ